jgi:hypothetical protein
MFANCVNEHLEQLMIELSELENNNQLLSTNTWTEHVITNKQLPPFTLLQKSIQLLDYFPTFPCSNKWRNNNINEVIFDNKLNELNLIYYIDSHERIEVISHLSIPEIFVVYKNFKTTNCIIISPLQCNYESYICYELSTMKDIETIQKKGVYHSLNDNPARVSKMKHSFIFKWYNYGKLHRDGDDPAYCKIDKSNPNTYVIIQYFKYGKLHRIGARPAILEFSGNLEEPFYEEFLYNGNNCIVSSKLSSITSFQKFVTIDFMTHTRFFNAGLSLMNECFQQVSNNMFNLILLYPQLPDELIIDSIFFLHSNCSIEFIQFVFNHLMTSIFKICQKRFKISSKFKRKYDMICSY